MLHAWALLSRSLCSKANHLINLIPSKLPQILDIYSVVALWLPWNAASHVIPSVCVKLKIGSSLAVLWFMWFHFFMLIQFHGLWQSFISVRSAETVDRHLHHSAKNDYQNFREKLLYVCKVKSSLTQTVEIS